MAERRARRRPATAAASPPVVTAAAIEAHLHALRGSLASLRAAAEALAPQATAWEPAPASLFAVVLEEAARSSDALTALAAKLDRQPADPAAAPIAVAAFAAALVATAQARADLLLAPAIDSVSGALSDPGGRLLAALVAVLRRLRRDLAVAEASLHLRLHDGLLLLDIGWAAGEPEQWRLRQEHADVLAGDGGGGDSLREVVRAQGGEVWLSFERTRAEVALRLLLPLVA